VNAACEVKIKSRSKINSALDSTVASWVGVCGCS